MTLVFIICHGTLKNETKSLSNVTYYVFHDRVTLFFADDFSTECQITVKFLHNFF